MRGLTNCRTSFLRYEGYLFPISARSASQIFAQNAGDHNLTGRRSPATSRADQDGGRRRISRLIPATGPGAPHFTREAIHCADMAT
jgi:hypothetical protein